ncbi:hypothetical protein DFJ58DRAFT_717382 [Suillus subalutaceus]|uniref:uncharacterized protein n=1 Tax=Suillus subalutaceus TaxID=48586 RepID=UPI001B8600C0|nr:uncharacterized protein DFJ58DRAFT_717382 [Suillus subalutaceus]KAG1846246.1 hypothetical protein DFJ58DRAFT_717382 [Suillus subalutaceus]
MPCSPISPVAGITLEALELYRVAHLRNPHLSIQAFVKTICDLHGVEFHRHISRQFSIALDIYLQIRRVVASLINKSLRRDSPDWRLKHACPACTYTLTDEEKLHFKILYAMDGNDSLKRILRRSLDDDDDSLGLSSELPTGQVLVSDRYLSRNFVEQFAQDTPCDTGANSLAENSCEGRWKNMDDAKTKKAWGIYDETGVFVAVCRHGFCLLIADMVQSGERAKYPLAIVAKLLDAFGDDLGGGYDIGCQFQTTLDNSSLGPLARSLRHSCLVGAFHGHAHRRLCIGIEDLETCERTFSKSNSLASALRYTSVFHRQQAIDSYFEHNDELEVYGNLLYIIANGEAVLPKVMQELKVEDESVFECWLEDEKIYLKETLQMEYWQRLVNLSASKVALDAGMNMFGTHNTPSYGADIGNTRKVESTRRHALEDYERNLKLVQLLECKLGIIARWVPEDEEWQKAGRLVANRKYQRALDRLEGLVVARIFELAKMNRAGTGYKLRKHIARALQTRSAAIRSALNTYNNLASAVYPPRQILKWEDVVEYAFLADFELLRKTRSDVSQLPWSSPAARSGMDLYFKMCRAREEICRLNIEVRRLVTYIRDEDKYLRVCEDRLTVANPALAHQIAIHRNIRGRFNSRHIKRLNDISKLPGFNGTLVPGLSACTGIGESASMPDPLIPANVFAAHIPAHNPSSPIGADTQEDLDEEEIAEEVAEEASRSLQDIITITADFSQLQLVVYDSEHEEAIRGSNS